MSYKDLAAAVILQAWLDAMDEKNSKQRIQARLFLTGFNPEWRTSLEKWCELSGNNSRIIIQKARKRLGR